MSVTAKTRMSCVDNKSIFPNKKFSMLQRYHVYIQNIKSAKTSPHCETSSLIDSFPKSLYFCNHKMIHIRTTIEMKELSERLKDPAIPIATPTKEK